MDPRIRPAARFTPFPRGDLARSIPARFADQVARHGARLAVRGPQATLTYEELDWASNRIADAVLAVLGGGPHRVALLLAQGTALVAAILGVLKAGKAYVPLDPSQPRSRLDTVLGHARPGLCLVDGEHAGLATAVAGLGIRSIQIEPVAGPRPALPPGVPVESDAAACIYYTSGSTGEPKGVLDTHRNVLHNVMRYTNSLGIGADDRLTLLQGPAFSGAVSSLFGALLNGAAVFPFDVPREGADRIAPWLARHGLTMYHSVPALFRRVATAGQALTSLRVVRLEGDLAVPQDVELFQTRCEPGTVLVNGLGATECGLVRQYVVDHETSLTGGTVPIGYPVEDMEVLLLDPEGQPAAAGEVGEIVVRSLYLAAGYWDRPDLTDVAFRPSPGGRGLRLYRTGDMGRMAADACLEHLGRRDQQVKVRGERVDVESIQAALLASGVAHEAVVAARRDGRGDAQLVAYLVPRGMDRPTTSRLRHIVLSRAPGQPVPSRFVLLDGLPLDPNGKVDRRALPPAGRDRPALDVAFVAPRTEREAALAAVWSDLLELMPIGVDDDFFDLGGDSLLAVELVARVADATGVDVGVADFADHSTVAALAALVDGAGEPPATGAPAAAGSPLFFLHSDYGRAGADCVMLVRQFGPDPRLVAVPPHGADGGSVPGTIEAMAARHVDRLRALQPRGPYHLAGHCSAGVVAFEVARQLCAAGEAVGTLVLVEPPPLRAVRDPDGRLQRLGPSPLRRAWHQARGLAARLGRAVRGRPAAGRRGTDGAGTMDRAARRGLHDGHGASRRDRLRGRGGALRRRPVARNGDVHPHPRLGRRRRVRGGQLARGRRRAPDRSGARRPRIVPRRRGRGARRPAPRVPQGPGGGTGVTAPGVPERALSGDAPSSSADSPPRTKRPRPQITRKSWCHPWSTSGPKIADPRAPPRNRKNANRATAVPRASGASSVARVWSVVWSAM